MKKLVLIDGNAILHRAYHSLPPFKTSKGETTNAIFGFIRMLFDIYSKVKPDYIGIAWDRKAPTYRHEEYKEYKATRTQPPDDLYPQLPRLKEVLRAFNIPMLEKDGYEADDILGTISHKAEKEPDLETTILTGDKDAFQLVSEKTKILAPIKGVSQTELYNPQKVKEKLGINPDQVVDYKALSGDASDNIPGVPGIGPKQATEMLNKYGSLDEIYKHINELPPGQKKKLEEGKKNAYLSQKLCALMLDAPVKFNLNDYKTHDINFNKVEALFEELEFKTLLKKLEDLKKALAPPDPDQQTLF